jgi:hypothetical protein
LAGGDSPQYQGYMLGKISHQNHTCGAPSWDILPECSLDIQRALKPAKLDGILPDKTFYIVMNLTN